MLRAIVLENFVHFKDKTVIDFDTSQTKKQSKKTSKKDSKALNIFVGANHCGKSTVLELIRRCMTDEINVSVTNSFDDNLIAYAFCKFSLDGYDGVISGVVKEHGKNSKVFITIKNEEYFICKRSLDTDHTYYGLLQTETDKKKIQSIFSETDNCNANSISHLLDGINSNEINKIEPSWNTIENKYVSTLPLRGIGMVQWTKSDNIKKEKNNYEKACERAEVISTLLFGDGKDDINKELEREIFQFITYPEVFHFHERKGCISVEHNKSVFPLLKTSEGILEAKLTSLLLAHKDFHTLCLEDPDRGMHPQMIERLKTVLHRAAYNKTIIVVTHSPYFIDTITVDKTHVFSRQKTKKADYTCSVTNALQNDFLRNVSSIETIRVLLFATKVLLVEGVTDREVVQGIFTHYKTSMLARRRKNTNYFWRDITTYQIIPLFGSRITSKVQQFCKLINLPCCCVWDLDNVVVLKPKQTNIIEKIKGICEMDFTDVKEKYDLKNKHISTFVSCDKDFNTVSKTLESEHNIFIWRYGTIESAIFETFENSKKSTSTFLGVSRKDLMKTPGKRFMMS